MEFKEESFDQVIGEIKPLLEKHYEEIALDKDVIKLNPDYEIYKKLCDSGMMKITTARQAGLLVGYCIVIVKHHLHYKDSLTAVNDIFFIDPAYRQGSTALKLFKQVEEMLKGYGVQRLVMNTKKHRDVGVLFDRLGYIETERVFTKIIG